MNKPTEREECMNSVRNKLMPFIALMTEVTKDKPDQKKVRHYVQMSRRNLDKMLAM